MSSYTTEIRFICEELSGFNESKGYADIEEIISLARPKIFNFNYPIFDENYKSVLETKILKHFYTREIGLETYGLWKLKLNTRMNEIMPYYNKLYSSELLEFNPLYTTNLTKTSKNIRNGNNTENEKENEKREEHNTLESEKGTTTSKASEIEMGTSTVTSGEYEKGTVNTTVKNMEKGTTTVEDGLTSSLTHYDLYSDTPQGALNGLESGEYLTNARKTIDEGGGYVTKTNSGSDTDNTTSTNSGKDTESVNVTNSGKDTERVNITNAGKDTNTEDKSESVGKERNLNKQENTTDDYLENVVGYDGVNTGEMLMKYRETFLNIDMMIIRQLEDLFFLLW